MLELETAIRQFESHIIQDRKHKHLSMNNYNAMKTQLNLIKAGVIDLDLNKIKNAYNKMYCHCDYSPSLRSKWTLLGLALGAFIEATVLTIISLATHAAIIPAWAWILNCTCIGTLGALLGHKIAEYKAKWEMHEVIYEAIDYLHAQDHHDFAREVESMVPWVHRMKHSLFAHSLDNMHQEPMELDDLSPS